MILPSWWLHVAPQCSSLLSETPLPSDIRNSDDKPNLFGENINGLN
jgi:hypothetical protein